MPAAQTTLRVDFVSESAGYRNTFGWYNKATGVGGILFAEVEAQGSHRTVTAGVSQAEFTVNTADLGNIEYFLIPNGGALSANSDAELAGPVKVIQLGNGSWAVATLDANGNVEMKNNKPNVLVGEDSNGFFTEKSKNEGGVDHASSVVGKNQTAATLAGDTADGTTGLIAWEDLAATKKHGTWSKPGDADYNDAVFRISIVNAPPVASADAASVGEDAGATTIAVLVNDTDPNLSDTLQVTAVNGAGLLGTVAIASGGQGIIYTPAAAFQSLGANQTTTETFSYTVSDQTGLTSTANVTVTIVGANDGPSALDDSANATEAGGVANETPGLDPAGNVLDNDTDPDTGDSKTVSAVAGSAANVGVEVTGSYGTLTLHTGGSYSYAVDNANATVQGLLPSSTPLTESFSYTMRDGAGVTSTASLMVTIRGVNDAPVGVDDTFAPTALGGAAVLTFDDFSAVYDYDVGAYTYQGLQFGGAGGSFFAIYPYDYGTNESGSAYTYAYSDYHGGVIQRIDGADFAVISVDAASYFHEGSPVSFVGYNNGMQVASLTTAVDPYYYSYPGYDLGPYGGPNGHIVFGPAFSDIDQLVITEGYEYFGDYIFIDNLSISVIASENFVADIDVLANDTDVDNGAVLSVFAVDASSALGAAVSLNLDGTVHYNSVGAAAIDALAAGEIANDTFSYTVTDEWGATDTAIVTVNLIGQNDAPVAVADSDAVVESGVNPDNSPFAGDDTAVGNILNNDADVDNGAVKTVSAVNGVAGNVGTTITGTYGSIVIGGDGSYTYTLDNLDGDTDALAQGASASEAFDYTVEDEFGASGSATLTIDIGGTNDTPVANADSNEEVDPVVEAGLNLDNSPFAGDLTTAGNVLTNDTDVDTGAIRTVGAVNGVTGNVGAVVTGTYGSVVIGSDGSYTYTLDNDDTDTDALAQGALTQDVFNYTVEDEFGASSSSTLTVNITGTNDNFNHAPVAVADTNGVDAIIEAGVHPGNTPFPGDPSAIGGGLIGGVYFSEDFSDNAASWTLGPQWQIGSTHISPPGGFGNLDPALDHTPTADNGVAGVVIGGNASTALHPFYYLTSPAFDTSDGAGAVGLSFWRWLNSDYTPFMHNVVDVWNGSQWNNIWSSGGAPGIADSAWSLIEHDVTAYANAAMQIRFGFDVTAGAFQVSSWNIDDIVVSSTLVASIAANVLANDTDADAGDTKTVQGVAAGTVSGPLASGVGAAIVGTYGLLNLAADGSWSYALDNADPDTNALAQGASASDVFSYTMRDTLGATSTTTLTIAIAGTNDTPVAVADPAAADEAGGVANGTAGTNPSGNVLTNDTDVDAGDSKTVTTTGDFTGDYGTLTLNANGSYDYVVNNSNAAVEALRTPSDTLTDTFDYTIQDTAGATSSSTLAVTIQGVNDAPVAVADTNGVDAVIEAGVHPGNTPFPGDPSAIGGGVFYFSEDFSDNAASWTLGSEWQIGPAQMSSGGSGFFGDPALDHTPTAGNGVAGVVIGGNASTALHPFRYLTSPVFDTSGAGGAVELSFWRWLNSDYTPFMQNVVDVWNGSQWNNIWSSGGAPGIADSAWSLIEHDVTAYANAAMQIRFGFNVGAVGAFNIGSWNIDDIVVSPGSTIAANVLANDTDADAGDTKTVQGVAAGAVSGPLASGVGASIAGTYGLLNLAADGSWSYALDNADPDTNALAQGASASDVFSYTMRDTLGATSTTTLTINILGTNDAPETAPVVLAGIAEDSGLRLITQDELLANASDLDGPNLSAVNLVIASGNGNLVDNGDGTWSYTPAPNDDGSVAFSYGVTDGSLSVAGTASLDITPVDDAPVAADDSAASVHYNVSANWTTNGNVLFNDGDPDGDTVFVFDFSSVATQNASAGELVEGVFGDLHFQANGTWNYLLDVTDPDLLLLDGSAQEEFHYTIADGHGLFDTATLAFGVHRNLGPIQGEPDTSTGF